MSPKEAPRGTGPDGRITPQDLRAKAEEVAGVEQEVQAAVSGAKPLMTYVAVGVGLVVVVAAFWLGRRSGRRKSTIVEIRRG